MKKLSKITESIWSDIQDRSAGEITRKEDDIDLLDEAGLVNYMEKLYMSPNDVHFVGDTLNQGCILAPLFDVDKKRYYSILYKKISTNKPEITFPVCQESDIENKLSELYKVTRLKQYNDQIYKIEPNDGSKITNKFFLEIVDFILDNVEDGINGINKIVFKKANESIWSDIQDRSAGDVVRREDMIITNEELTNKIKQLYKEQGNADTLNVSSLNKYKFDDLSYLFYNLEKVKQIIGLETWDVSNVTDMSSMFCDCTNLTELNISNWDVSNVTDMSSMFNGCSSLTELDISNWDVSNVTNMGFMFSCCQNLTELNISNWDVSNVTNMNGMFNVCKNLTELNISNWDVSNVTNMGFMFDHCSSLTELNIDNWDVSNVTDMRFMFRYCSSLTELNISNWDVSNVTNMGIMFCHCTNLTELNISNWDVSNVTNMYSMFDHCSSLTELNIDNWDVNNVTHMSDMFSDCDKLIKPKWYNE